MIEQLALMVSVGRELAQELEAWKEIPLPDDAQDDDAAADVTVAEVRRMLELEAKLRGAIAQGSRALEVAPVRSILTTCACGALIERSKDGIRCRACGWSWRPEGGQRRPKEDAFTGQDLHMRRQEASCPS